MGKSKFSKEIVEKLCKYVSLGLSNEQAANCCDISEHTYYEWLKTYPQLAQDLKKAKDEGEASNLAIIHEAKRRNWPAAAWLLERQHQTKYALRHDVNISGRLKTESSHKTALDSMDRKAIETLQAKLDAVIRSNKSK